MKKIFWLYIFLSLFSCKKEDNISIQADTELWLKVSSSIEKMNVSFIGENIKGTQHMYVIKYIKGVFDQKLKTANDKIDGETWTLVYTSSEKTDEIAITCNNKKYKIRGFSFDEKRLLEIVYSFEGVITIKDHDISLIEKIIVID